MARVAVNAPSGGPAMGLSGSWAPAAQQVVRAPAPPGERPDAAAVAPAVSASATAGEGGRAQVVLVSTTWAGPSSRARRRYVV